MTSHYTLPSRRAQTTIGLSLAGLIVGGWLGLHAYAMLVFELSWSNWPVALVMAAVQCWLSVGVFIISHDAMHGSLAPGHNRLSAAIGAVILFLYAGFAWRRMRDAHFAHHKMSGHTGDPDFDEQNPSSFIRWFTTFFRRYFGFQSLIYVNAVVVIYWLIIDIPMAQIVLLYGAPALLSSLQLFYFGTFRPHHHKYDHGTTDFADSHNARSEEFGTLVSLVTCFHFGYHLEHHRRPDVPWWALPGAYRAGIGQTPESEPVRTGEWAA